MEPDFDSFPISASRNKFWTSLFCFSRDLQEIQFAAIGLSVELTIQNLLNYCKFVSQNKRCSFYNNSFMHLNLKNPKAEIFPT